MNTKLFTMLLAAVLMTLMTFTACGDDENGGGGNGKVWVDKKGGKTQRFDTLDDALFQVMQSGPGEYTIRIGENQHITSQFNFFTQKEQTITIKAESGTVEITRSSELLHHFWVSFESTLILDKGIILKGSGDGISRVDYGVWLDDKGKLIINEGAKMTDFCTSAIFADREGRIEMNGGTICDNINCAVTLGREVGTGVFIMNGGSISDNGFNEGSGSCGVVIRDGTFIMNDGVISGNADGGVSVYEGKFTMKKGRIINNKIKYYGSGGGGVFVGHGTFIMDGGEISGNTATYGGGVEVGIDGGSGVFTMNGGTIAKNVAEEIGGGVYVYSYGTFTMNGGTISGNTAEKRDGGGVCLRSEATFTKTGKSIIYGENGGTNANKVLSYDGVGHAACVSTSQSVKRDLTAGEDVVIRWSNKGATKQGWDN